MISPYLQGEIQRINRIPFDAPESAAVVGTGYTPEGIDQNPVYYEFMAEQHCRAAPVPDITAWAVTRAHRRYGLKALNADVASAWSALIMGAYSLVRALCFAS